MIGHPHCCSLCGWAGWDRSASIPRKVRLSPTRQTSEESGTLHFEGPAGFFFPSASRYTLRGRCSFLMATVLLSRRSDGRGGATASDGSNSPVDMYQVIDYRPYAHPTHSDRSSHQATCQTSPRTQCLSGSRMDDDELTGLWQSPRREAVPK